MCFPSRSPPPHQHCQVSRGEAEVHHSELSHGRDTQTTRKHHQACCLRIKDNLSGESWECRSQSGRSLTSLCHPAICKQRVNRLCTDGLETHTLIIHLSFTLTLKNGCQPLKHSCLCPLCPSIHPSAITTHSYPALSMEYVHCQTAHRWLLAE